MGRIILSLSYFCLHLLASSAARKPNFVMVIADDLGFDDICFDEEKHWNNNFRDCSVTPTFLQLQKEGIILNNFYVQPLCSPTRGALLTGKYPIHTGLQTHVLQPTQPGGLPLHHRTIAEELKDKFGYRTTLVGKWHLGYSKKKFLPTYRGFDEFYGMYVGAADHYERIPSLGNASKRFLALDYLLTGRDLHRQDEPADPETDFHSTDLYLKEALNVISRHKTQYPELPLFLMVSFQAVHDPIQVPEKWVHMNMDRISDPHRQQLAGMVTHLDDAIGNLVLELKKQSMWANTVFLFFSDNGGEVKMGSSNWPYRGKKGTLFEGGIKSKAILSGGLIQTKNVGSSCDAIIHITDVFPTFLGLASGNTEYADQIDGVSFWPTVDSGCTKDSIQTHPRKGFLVNIDPVGYPLNFNSDTVNYYTPYAYLRRLLAKRLSWADRSSGYRHLDMKLVVGYPGSGVLSTKPYNLSHYLEKLAEEDATHAGKADPKCETIENLRDCMWLFNLSADPTESHNLVGSRSHRHIVVDILERIETYRRTMVQPVNKNGIFRSEMLQDIVSHLPIRFINVYPKARVAGFGYFVPFEDLQLHGDASGVWLAHVILLASFGFVLFTPLVFLIGISFFAVRLHRR